MMSALGRSRSLGRAHRLLDGADIFNVYVVVSLQNLESLFLLFSSTFVNTMCWCSLSVLLELMLPSCTGTLASRSSNDDDFAVGHERNFFMVVMTETSSSGASCSGCRPWLQC